MQKFYVEERVRWRDVDHAGIVRYDAYLRFFEFAEMEFFRALGLPFAQVHELLGIWMPRVQMHCDFHSPARLDDLLRIAVYVSYLRRTSMRFDFEIDTEGRRLVSGYLVIVTVDRERFSPIEVPQELRTRLTPYVAKDVLTALT
ncbi:MAG: thioesterase family protein [Acidobacteriota bacterium]|nr:acyl-CoA thioesterase [Blastocatellia bacterium]MDW8411561.1 thioesterase family protein [Acidobacteriota bacterium]